MYLDNIRITWTPKVCKIMAFMAVIMGLGLLFYILLGFRNTLNMENRMEHKMVSIYTVSKDREPLSLKTGWLKAS